MLRPLICVLLPVLLLAVVASAQEITSIKPTSGAPGDPILISGSGFGMETGQVKIGDKIAKTTNWSDTSIIATVPRGVGTGEVSLTVTPKNGTALTTKKENNITVNAPEFDASHFELLTGVGAKLSGVEATSYKVDNDALSSTNVGRKTPEILLGGGFILPWRKTGGWIENAYCGAGDKKRATAKADGATLPEPSADCAPGGAYYHYRPWEAFVSIRFAPASDQTINGFVLGGGYRITKYLSLLVGYSVTPVDEPSRGFRIAASQIIAANPTISPYNRYNANDVLHADERPGVLDGFPLFVYDANGITTQKLFPTSPTVTHYRSGIYFGVGIPLNLTSLFNPNSKK